MTPLAQAHRAERAARDATACQPVETEGITRLPAGIAAMIWAALLVPMWGGVIALLRWLL